MADNKGKYSAISELRQPRTEQKEQQPAPRRDSQEEAANKGGRGGKRSDPDYSPTTFFVRKETKRKAAKLLLDDARAGKDLSDIVEELLSKWVSENSHA